MKNLETLTNWQENSYFKEREGHYFLVSTFSPMLQVCKLYYEKGYWFDATYGQIKATSARCVSLNDLNGVKVYYRGYPRVQGVLGGYGVLKTPFVYVFWGQVPMKDTVFNFAHSTPNKGQPLGFPCALPDNHNLILNEF